MNFVSRAEWGARAPYGSISTISSQGTTGHWEGGTLWAGENQSHDRCASIVRAIQNYHMDHNGWTDIAYNALACPHGYVFEGRGPGRRSAANGTNTANGASAVVCYVGGVDDPFTEEGKRGMADAAAYLLGELKWGHRDWYATQCPGQEIYDWIQSGVSVPPVPPPSPPSQPPTPPPTSGGYEVQVRTLQRNDRQAVADGQVKTVQSILISKAGQRITADGFFGPATEEAVINWQRWWHLEVDGIVGPQTWGSLVSL